VCKLGLFWHEWAILKHECSHRRKLSNSDSVEQKINYVNNVANY
jgi:hypothetical protein